jgi:hypothetical protein
MTQIQQAARFFVLTIALAYGLGLFVAVSTSGFLPLSLPTAVAGILMF